MPRNWNINQVNPLDALNLAIALQAKAQQQELEKANLGARAELFFNTKGNSQRIDNLNKLTKLMGTKYTQSWDTYLQVPESRWQELAEFELKMQDINHVKSTASELGCDAFLDEAYREIRLEEVDKLLNKQMVLCLSGILLLMVVLGLLLASIFLPFYFSEFTPWFFLVFLIPPIMFLFVLGFLSFLINSLQGIDVQIAKIEHDLKAE